MSYLPDPFHPSMYQTPPWPWDWPRDPTSLPSLTITPIAGAMVDRQRKMMMMVSDIGAGNRHVSLFRSAVAGALESWHPTRRWSSGYAFEWPIRRRASRPLSPRTDGRCEWHDVLVERWFVVWELPAAQWYMSSPCQSTCRAYLTHPCSHACLGSPTLANGPSTLLNLNEWRKALTLAGNCGRSASASNILPAQAWWVYRSYSWSAICSADSRDALAPIVWPAPAHSVMMGRSVCRRHCRCGWRCRDERMERL